MKKLQEILQNYGIIGEISGITQGAMLKTIGFKPAPGTKIRQITAVSEDIRRELGVASLRIETQPESGTVAFEIPNGAFRTIGLASALSSPEFKAAAQKQALPLLMGENARGIAIVADLAKMPHLLIGGTTGSGKSVGLNAFILSLMAARTPEELKFVLIDPKRIEFGAYSQQKYLLAPVVTESAEAAAVLAYLAAEMGRRYAIFAKTMSRNLAAYNETASSPLPYIVCVIDEFADLMATDKNLEKDVMRLAQKARAAGIHLILATQRPSVDVVTGVLKANFPARLAYKAASSADSRTILGEPGAESLLGRGDSLYLAADGTLSRIHGAYADDAYIAAFLKPYRAPVKPLPAPMPPAASDSKKNAAQAPDSEKKAKAAAESSGFFARLWRFWANLRAKDRKLIVNAVKSVFAFFLGAAKRRRK